MRLICAAVLFPRREGAPHGLKPFFILYMLGLQV